MTRSDDLMGNFNLYVGIGIAILGVAFVVAPVPTTVACVAVTAWVLRDYVPGVPTLPKAWVRRKR